MNPAERAKELIKKYNIPSPAKLNLEEIANAENLIVEEENLRGSLGKIIYQNGYGLIKISKKLEERGQKRFTLAHEIGHYKNEKDALTQPLPKGEGKYTRLYKCTTLDMYSFKSPKIYENEANEFASELLMHKPWFGKYIKERKVDMKLMTDIAEYFDVSLSAAAFRYSKIGKYPIAVIVSETGSGFVPRNYAEIKNVKGEIGNARSERLEARGKTGVVKWSSINEYFPYKWIPNGYKLREESSAYDFFQGKEVQTCSDLVPAHTWFSEDYKCDQNKYLWEQSIVMHKYNSVLTLLWQQ